MRPTRRTSPSHKRAANLARHRSPSERSARSGKLGRPSFSSEPITSSCAGLSSYLGTNIASRNLGGRRFFSFGSELLLRTVARKPCPFLLHSQPGLPGPTRPRRSNSRARMARSSSLPRIPLGDSAHPVPTPVKLQRSTCPVSGARTSPATTSAPPPPPKKNQDRVPTSPRRQHATTRRGSQRQTIACRRRSPSGSQAGSRRAWSSLDAGTTSPVRLAGSRRRGRAP